MNLNEWQQYINTKHPAKIALGLERINAVADRLQSKRFTVPVVMVAGTNGKGSCIAFLREIYTRAGYRVGSFMSPQLLTLNDQIHIAGQECSEQQLCQALAAVEAVRGNVPLTEFEFVTLSALWLFQQAHVDIVLLEVGMGGRDDAVNIVEPDVAVVTTVALDHQAWLGKTRELIALHKAGIYRHNKPAIYGDNVAPQSLVDVIEQVGAHYVAAGIHFQHQLTYDRWTWQFQNKDIYCNLPIPKLDITNASIALMVVHLLEEKMSVIESAVYQGIQQAELPGRFQVVHDTVTTVFDIAHNPQACALLANKIKQMFAGRVVRVVVGMRRDKDIATCLNYFRQCVAEWYVADLPSNQRGASAEYVAAILQEQGLNNIRQFESVKCAYRVCLEQSQGDDVILVFGSFLTVADAMQARIRKGKA